MGENAFTHEAGIHVHGLLADTSTYEPIHPESVGRKRRIVLGKHAGRSSVELALREFGLTVSENQLAQIVARVKELGDKGKRVGCRPADHSRYGSLHARWSPRSSCRR